MSKKRTKTKKKERDAGVVLFMGKNGTGKSTLAENIVKKLNTRALVITLNGAPKIWRKYDMIDPANKSAFKSWKKGIKSCIYMQHEKDTIKHIYNNFNNGILIFDDCRGYLTSNVDNDIYLKRLLIDFRHKMLDLYFIFHTPTDVPPRIWGFYTHAFIGATDALFPKSRIKTDSAERIIAAQQKVNPAFSKAKARNDSSHYGLFMQLRP